MTGIHDRIGDAPGPLGQWLAAAVREWLASAADMDVSKTAIEIERLGHLVYRVRAIANGGSRSVIVKQLEADAARRNRLVAERWLPALGLESVAPRVLSPVTEAGDGPLWLMYEDVGGIALKECQSDRDSVAVAVERIADLHTRAADHACVDECRREGGDLGMYYFDTQVNDASRLLEALQPPAVQPSSQQAEVRDRLRRRLDDLVAQAPHRARVMAAEGGPDTMLHGDLWTTNVVIVGSDDRLDARLVDWDRAGAGPIVYDLSTFLFRFERAARSWVVDRYSAAVARAGWRLPPVTDLNLLCDTAERARYASRIVWPAAALLEEGATWGFAELRAIDEWFEALEPVLDE